MKQNIILIGMPGCGKTTIGKLLAQKTGMDFIDLDAYIEAQAGRTIPEIFKEGEDAFRKLESEAVVKLREIRNTVLSTGGGIVIRPENMAHLKLMGKIIFIDRPLLDIASDVNMAGRPLLRDGLGKLYELYDLRYDLYKKYCEIRIENNRDLIEIIDKIIECLNKEACGK